MANTPVPKSRRIALKDGTAVLRHDDVADLQCLLIELGDSACKVKFSLQTIPVESAVVWKQLLVPGRQLVCHVTAPNIVDVDIATRINHLLDFGTYSEAELDLILQPQQKAVLSRALFGHQMHSFDLPPVPKKAKAAETFSTAGVKTLITPMDVPSTAQKTMQMPMDNRTLIEPPSVAMKPATTLPTEGIIGASDSDFLRNRKLGEVLIHMGHLTPQQVAQAVRASQVIGERLGRYLVRESCVTPKILCHALALQSGLPTTDITGVTVPPELIELFTVATMQEHRILPFDQAKTFICVATADVLTPKEIRALETQCGRRIQLFLADEDELVKQIDQILRRRTARKHPRYPLVVPVVYQFCSRLGTPVDETVYFVTSVNFSQGGMAIQGVPEAVGTLADTRRQDMYANVIVKALPNEIEARCQVRWVRKGDKNPGTVPKYQIGMEFVEITDENRVRLANLCV